MFSKIVMGLLCLTSTLWALEPTETKKEKKRIIITTDIGGSDPDDIQSLIHLFFHLDEFDVEGIIVGRPGGRKRMAMRVWRAYRRDYPKLAFHSADYPTPGELKKLIRVGSRGYEKSPPKGWSKPTRGSRWILKSMRKEDPRKLHVLCWGASTDLAQALHDAGRKGRREIFKKLNIFCGDAGFNNDKDPYPTQYLNKFRKLRWVGGYGSGRGIYWGGLWSKKKYGNIGFVEKVLAPSGAMGRLYKRISKDIDVNRGGIKMGDTVTLLFAWKGDFDRPKKPSWGGRYCRVRGRPNRFKPCPGDDLGGRPGGAAVAPYRLRMLKAWERKINRLNTAPAVFDTN